MTVMNPVNRHTPPRARRLALSFLCAALSLGAWPVSYTHLTLPTSDLV